MRRTNEVSQEEQRRETVCEPVTFKVKGQNRQSSKKRLGVLLAVLTDCASNSVLVRLVRSDQYNFSAFLYCSLELVVSAGAEL